MSESKHTAGWSLREDAPDYLDGIQSGLTVHIDGRPVAYMFDRDEAVLATAAPEMLAALKKLYEAAWNSTADFDPELFVQADVAIQKATA